MSEVFIYYPFYSSSDYPCCCVVERGVEGDIIWVSMKKHYVECTCGGICSGCRWMAAVGGIQFNFVMVASDVSPYASYGT